MTKKADEIALYDALRNRAARAASPWTLPGVPRVLALQEEAARLGIHEKRAFGLVSKWADRGWWEYGVSLRAGWFTPSAPASLRDGGKT